MGAEEEEDTEVSSQSCSAPGERGSILVLCKKKIKKAGGESPGLLLPRANELFSTVRNQENKPRLC